MSLNSQSRPAGTQAAVKVFYGDDQLIPAPLIDWTTESIHRDDGNRVGVIHKLVLDGSFILPSGAFEKIWNQGHAELRTIFADDFKEFRILAGPGNVTLPEDAPILSGIYPRILNLSVEPDLLVNRLDYNVELEGKSGVVDAPVESFSDSWQFREDPDSQTIEVEHSVNARGFNTSTSGGTNAHTNALNFVKPRLGLSNIPDNFPNYLEPNTSDRTLEPISTQRTETIDEGGGTYQATEVFRIASGVTTFYDQRTFTYSENDENIATVTVNGTVQGLGRTNLTDDFDLGFQRALSAFKNTIKPALPADASGVYLNYKENPTGSGLVVSSPQSISITENRFRGTIDYSYEYTDDPAENLPSGIADRSCSETKVFGLKLQQSHPIPYRRLGNLIQDIQTSTEGRITINCSSTAKNTGDKVADTNRAVDFTESELNRLKPSSSDFITLRIDSLEQTTSDVDLTCSATVVYAFTIDRSAAPDVDSDIALTPVT